MPPQSTITPRGLLPNDDANGAVRRWGGHGSSRRCRASGCPWPNPIGLALCLLLAPSAFAARWTLVQFGASPGMTATPYPGWTEVIRHPTFSKHVDPDGDPSHAGLVETEGIPEGQTAYFGVRGTVPIQFRPGHRVIVTFCNRSEEYASLDARISFNDPDEPDPTEPEGRWYTLVSRRYQPEGEWVPPGALFELEHDVSDPRRVNAAGGPPSQGTHRLVNINKPYADLRFVLTRVELSDEADLTPPGPPLRLRAQAVELSAGAGASAIRLSWDAATDPPPHATGVSRYLIYRDGTLYDTVTADLTSFLGNHLYYLDLNVAPDTPYTYRVSALDGAVSGLYPVAGRWDSRVGNESVLSDPVEHQTPPWTASRLLNPWVDFVYRGVIRLPSTPGGDWAYAASGLAYYPEGNPDRDPATELAGSLYALTAGAGGLSEIAIPHPVLPGGTTPLPVARTIKPPADLWPRIYADGASTPPGGGGFKVASLAYHPATQGVSSRLYYGVADFYATDATAPSHGWFNLELTQGEGAWFLGGLPPDNIYPGTAVRYLFAVPAAWAAQHTGGRSLLAGNTFLSGGLENFNGPTLYAIAPWEHGILPPNGTALPATTLLRYSPIGTPADRVVNWRIDEFAEGAAWLSHGARQAVAISYRRTVGDVWYGDPLGNNQAFFDIPEPLFGSKGAGASAWRNGLMLYNPDDLAAVAHGERAAWEPQPYVVFDTEAYSRRLSTELPQSGAIAYAENLHLLFYLEYNGDAEEVQGLLHVWEIAPPRLLVLRLRRTQDQCLLEWETETDGRTYQVEATPTLDGATWSSYGPAAIGDGQPETVSCDFTAATARFFRLRRD